MFCVLIYSFWRFLCGSRSTGWPYNIHVSDFGSKPCLLACLLNDNPHLQGHNQGAELELPRTLGTLPDALWGKLQNPNVEILVLLSIPLCHCVRHQSIPLKRQLWILFTCSYLADAKFISWLVHSCSLFCNNESKTK